MSKSRGSGGPRPHGRRGHGGGGLPWGLPRAQIDILLERIAAEARQCAQANPGDPAVFRRVVVRIRELLRSTALEHHLHIGDTAQLLLQELEDGTAPAPDQGEAPACGPGIRVNRDGFMHAARMTGQPVADVGLQLADDPFDIDSYAPAEDANGPALQDPPTDAGGAVPKKGPAGKERRRDRPGTEPMHEGLSAAQLATLDTMSQFGWTLRFVRRPMFQPPIPVVFDRNRQRFVVVEADGSVNDEPGLKIRD